MCVAYGCACAQVVLVEFASGGERRMTQGDLCGEQARSRALTMPHALQLALGFQAVIFFVGANTSTVLPTKLYL